MKLPRVYPLTIPSSHSTMRMIAIVSSICLLLGARVRAARWSTGFSGSNSCAVKRPRAAKPVQALLFLCLLAFALWTEGLLAQSARETTPQRDTSRGKQVVAFLTGAAVAL